MRSSDQAATHNRDKLKIAGYRAGVPRATPTWCPARTRRPVAEATMKSSLLERRFAELVDQWAKVEAAKKPLSGDYMSGFTIEEDVLLNWTVKARNLLVTACGNDSEHYKQFIETAKPQAYGTFQDDTIGDSSARLVIPAFLSPKTQIAVLKTDHHEDFKKDSCYGGLGSRACDFCGSDFFSGSPGRR
jgi:hypothetical protein